MENKYVNADNFGTEGVKFLKKLSKDVREAELKDIRKHYIKFRSFCNNSGLITHSENISINKAPLKEEFREYMLAEIDAMIAIFKSRETRLWKIIISRLSNFASIIGQFVKSLICSIN